jgi:5'-nucleotidase
MKLLLSNDDGVFASGIIALASELGKNHEVFISAPDRERSAVSRAMTLFSPLRAKRTSIAGLPDVPAYAVSGTPVDCVRLALGNLVPNPDLVVSGINLGPNLGTDVLYSGTVAAAHEAALLGYQSIAISCLSYEGEHLETATRVAAMAVEYLAKHPLDFGTLLNVNVPAVPFSELKGIKAAPLGVQQYALEFVEREDPMDRKYYWAPRCCTTCVDGLDVDVRWANEGYVTLTPLTYDLTNTARLNEIAAQALTLTQESDLTKRG